ncbi:MAG: phosphoadenylyl-sulfate reductase [Rhodospirillales bacterium]|nr:phosphoadenylyl-sulfate reductase [Rhodospirillales bacterium]
MRISDLPPALTTAARDPSGRALLEEAMCRAYPGRLAIVSSFGAESAILLALAAEIDRTVPVLFLDTGQHFPATLAYRRRLADRLGLRDVRDIRGEAALLAAHDADSRLHARDADACCAMRKVAPLARALSPFAAWVSGRKRHQSASRADIPPIEIEEERVKLNPLAAWTAAMIEAEMRRRNLPRHPLSLAGYPSIGCAPCTRAVTAGEDPRSGRWAGNSKTECGIHRRHDLAHAGLPR